MVGNLDDMTPTRCSGAPAGRPDSRGRYTHKRCADEKFDISTPMMSHHKFNEHATAALHHTAHSRRRNHRTGKRCGNPRHIRSRIPRFHANAANMTFLSKPLPGATALIPALVIPVFLCDCFTFEGFLPPKKRTLHTVEGTGRRAPYVP